MLWLAFFVAALDEGDAVSGGVVDVVADQTVVSIAKIDLVAHMPESSYAIAEGDKRYGDDDS